MHVKTYLRQQSNFSTNHLLDNAAKGPHGNEKDAEPKKGVVQHCESLGLVNGLPDEARTGVVPRQET